MKVKIISRILLLVIAGALILLSLSACGTTSKVVSKQTVDSTVTTNTSKATATTVKEKVDTTVTVKGDTATASKPLDNFIAGDTIEAETNGTRLKVWYDHGRKSVYGEAISEPKQVAVTIDRETTTNTNEATQSEAQVSKSEVHKDIHRAATPWYFSPFPWLALIILVLAGYLFFRYLPK